MLTRILSANRHKRVVYFIALILLTAAFASQLPQLTIDRSDDKLISMEDPGRVALSNMQKRFGAEQNVLIYVRDENLWTYKRLLALQSLTFALADLAEITKVNSLFTTTNIRDKGDFVEAGPLIDLVPRTEEKIARLKDDALYSPLMRNSVISEDGKATVISLGYQGNDGDKALPLHIYQKIDGLLRPLAGEFTEIFQIGSPRLNHDIGTGMFRDLSMLVPLAIAILLVTISFFLRSLRALPIPLITSTLTLVWTFGFMAFVGIPLTILTAMVPALVIVIGSTEDVHLISAFSESLKTPDGGVKQARELALKLMASKVGLPIVITSLTTALGFAANAVTDIPLIREFAAASAFAMLANLVVTVLSMPLLLMIFGPTNRAALRNDDHNIDMPAGIPGSIVSVIESLSQRFPWLIISVTTVILFLFSLKIWDVQTNNDPLSYFRQDHGFVIDANTMHRDIAGMKTFSIMMSSDHERYFASPAGVKKLAQTQALLDNTRHFDNTQSLAKVLSLMHQEYHQGDPKFFHVPQSREDLDLYLSSLSRSDLETFVTEDFQHARITVRHHLEDSNKLIRLLDAFSQQTERLLGVDANHVLTGKSLMINSGAKSLLRGQVSSLLLILFVIFCLFSFLYTSFLAGLLSLVPNAIPVILNFGLMGYLGVPLNPGTAMVAAIAIGVAVDDTVHLMTRFGAESRAHIDEADAVRATIRGEAVPIVSTSIALALGFSVLSYSNFNIVAQFGLLAAATMIYALVADLLIMPILLKYLRLATVWDIVGLKLDRDVLVGCPLFRGMSPYAIKKVVLLSHMQDFENQAVIIEKGTRSHGMYVVLAGLGQVQFKQGDVELDIDYLRPGDVFGEIGFSGEDVERTATVVAHQPMTVVKLDAESTKKGLRFYPRIASRLHRNISNILGQRLIESHQRLADYVGET